MREFGGDIDVKFFDNYAFGMEGGQFRALSPFPSRQRYLNGMHELLTDVEIAARPEDVWAVLTDFATYPRWNPFIRYVDGAAEEGSSLEVFIHPPGGRRASFRPRVLIADAPRELRWRAHLMVMPGVFEGEHRFLVQPLPNGSVRFEQSERFSGFLTPLMRDRIDRSISRGFREMNAALKGRVERGGT